jgi:predicted RND superfamily exporter protein
LHNEDTTVDQSLIFSRTLYSLLKNAGLRGGEWHDPRFELPEDFTQRLNDYDGVVLLEDDPRYRKEELERYANFVVDARDHYYEDGPSATTALSRNNTIGTMYTGLVPIVYKAQHALLQSLVESTGWAFVAISIVMILVLRSVSAGLISMIPNIFPVVIVFGYMGWRQTLVDIGTMMTASVAMGVAVDDTVHFLTWFRRGLDEGRDRKGAIMLAYDRCATAMTQTTLIGGLGLSVFAFSTFTPTQRFGVLMLTLMVAALIGDLVFLPAILAGPAGRVFSRSKRAKKSKPALPPDDKAAPTEPPLEAVRQEPIRMKPKRASSGMRLEGRHRRPGRR